MGLKNRGEINDVGVHADDDFPSFEVPILGDRWPDGVSISGVDARGVAGMEMSSVSGRSSMLVFMFMVRIVV